MATAADFTDENNRNNLNIDEIPKLLNDLNLNGKCNRPATDKAKNIDYEVMTVRSAVTAPIAPEPLPPKAAVIINRKQLCSAGAAAAAAATSKPQNRPITRSQSLTDKPSVKVFKVCGYVERYAAQKEAKIKKITAEEKQKRQFHSRPAPDFTAARKKLDVLLQQNRKIPTCPDSPQVYRNSKEMIDRRNKKVRDVCVCMCLTLKS